ncbi:LPS export ABC transporter periplasmic protein LptC [Fastidiosibacter lacustris]|uniref:LPS export ABC transporter periplasmic protein LptC n=1 Tax=Fastidiosibacter lacustris TaxID=2056695 RepID=UPI000E3429C6|nr:LPS export ABC transporter periplasmic protein LptC [Fastidiosibacter lacustris]
MFFSKRVFFSTIGLSVVVGSSGWLVVKSAQEQISHGELPAHFIENTAEGLRYEKYDQKGWLQYSLYAKQGKRFYNQDAVLSEVNAEFFSKDQNDKPWYITANNADVTNNNNNIRLYGNVIMQRQANGNSSPAIKITTEMIDYDNNKDDLNTDKLVTFTEPGTPNNTVGLGLSGAPKKGNFTLLKNVRSYYAGQNAKN